MGLGLLIVYISYKYDLEPLLLIPIGFFMFAVNLPHSPLAEPGGLMDQLFGALIRSELLPLLIFIGIGAMMDFGPLMANPSYMLLAIISQLGIFLAFLIAIAAGFDINGAASVAAIGTADGPTSIYIASKLKPELVGPVSMAAYSYVSIVPLIIPPLVRALVSKRELSVQTRAQSEVSLSTKLVFPFAVILVAGLLAPLSVPLLGFLLFGYFLRENGRTGTLKEAAEKILAPTATIFVGMLIGASMKANVFFATQTLLAFAIGLAAFVLNIAAGLLAGKVIHLFDSTFNPAIGAAGNSAFPMAARVVHKFVQKREPGTFILLATLSANAAGQLASVFAGTFLLQGVLSGGKDPVMLAAVSFGKSFLAMIALILVFSVMKRWK
ncbi:sodium ion-translocating decarboxylase subunit beta [Coprothermobacteraceae bacterium]|nr:sodium ion-translocating decarboxylase subunit beta [Coprothermobacteraceae bacterium]